MKERKRENTKIQIRRYPLQQTSLLIEARESVARAWIDALEEEKKKKE